jgi:RND family efflux transporter MFP subunit
LDSGVLNHKKDFLLMSDAIRTNRTWLSSWWVRLSLVVVVLGAAAFLSSLSQGPTVQSTSVVTLFPSQALSTLNASGYVVAQRKAAVSTKAQGRLEWLGVTEGSRVRQGEVIARLESLELTAQLAQAEAQLGLAQAELDDAVRAEARAKSLLAQAYISQSSFDAALARANKAKAQVRASQAARDVARAALSQTEIRAPFDGVVLTKNANVGDNITPFSSAADSKGAVVTIADMRTLEVEADVSESSMAKIQVGQPVDIGLDALPNVRFSGRIARMVPTIDRAKATRLVKLEFDQIDPRILPDMSAKVAFLPRALRAEERQPVRAVAKAAVSQQGGQSTVFVLEKGSVQAVVLSNPQTLGDDLVLAPELKEGQSVVLRPPPGLKSGQAVRVEKT